MYYWSPSFWPSQAKLSKNVWFTFTILRKNRMTFPKLWLFLSVNIFEHLTDLLWLIYSWLRTDSALRMSCPEASNRDSHTSNLSWLLCTSGFTGSVTVLHHSGQTLRFSLDQCWCHVGRMQKCCKWKIDFETAVWWLRYLVLFVGSELAWVNWTNCSSKSMKYTSWHIHRRTFLQLSLRSCHVQTSFQEIPETFLHLRFYILSLDAASGCACLNHQHTNTHSSTSRYTNTPILDWDSILNV